MPLYHADVPAYCTFYVKAETEAAALAAILAYSRCDLCDVEVSILNFDDHHLPEISLSPAMTFGEFDPAEIIVTEIPR